MERLTTESNRRDGFTVIELIIVIALIGVLLALVLPAIAASRNAAMRLQCQNRMHQLGIGATSFAEVHGVFPYRDYVEWMPFLGEQNLRQALLGNPSNPTFLKSLGLSTTVFICPSDPLANSDMGHVNYMFNEGNSLAMYGRGNGIGTDVGSRDVIDGLSQTALMSETLIRMRWVVYPKTSFTEAEAQRDPKRFLWYIPEAHWPHNVDLASFNDMCDHQRLGATPLVDSSANVGWVADHGYHHIRPPNSVGCYDGPPTTFGPIHGALINAVPAQSEHIGGVQLLMGDGAVRFVNENVDFAVWSASGSRNGGEAVGQQF